MEKTGKSPSYLRRVGTRYHFRYAFPKKYCNLLPGEIRLSLKTGDLYKARSLSAMLANEARSFIEDKGVYMAATPKEIKAALGAYLRAILDLNDLKRLEGKDPFEMKGIAPVTMDKVAREGMPKADPYAKVPGKDMLRLNAIAIKDQLLNRECYPEAEVDKNAFGVKDFLASSGLDVPEDSPTYEYARRELLKIEQAINRIEQERCQGEYNTTTELSILAAYPEQPTGPVVAEKRVSRPISEYVEQFIEEKRSDKKCKATTFKEYTNHLKLFVELSGDCPLSDIDFEKTREFFDKLKKYPTHRNKRREYRGKSTEEILAMNLPKEKCISDKTVNNYMTSVTAFQAWASQREYMRKNFALGMSVRIETRSDEERDSFTDNDIKIIFDDLRKVYKYPTTAMKKRQAHRWWVPLIGAYSGARLEEIPQLHIEDVTQDQGIWIFNITDMDDRELKNKGSRRKVPIHEALIEAGFLDYYKKIKSDGEGRLFPDLKPVFIDEMPKYGQYITKWFGPYLQKMGVKSETRKVSFHSFRHSFVSKAKVLEIPENKCAQVVGHVAGKITYNRYGDRFELEKIQPVVNQITYGIEGSL